MPELPELPELPEAARAVVIGGGVGGTSVALHLARLGWRDVLLVEQHELSDGTTWHSAGFVGQLRSSIAQTRMIVYSTQLYDELEGLTGIDAGWRRVGGLRVASTPLRMEELRRQASAATTYELDLELLDPAQIARAHPWIDTSDLLGAAWLPGDGYVEPAPLAHALAEAARRLGVRIETGVRVTGLERSASGRICAVQTDAGPVEADVVVVCAGCASREVAALADALVPVVPIRHQYVRTEPLNPPLGEVATLRDPDRIVYMRPDGNGLLVGGYARDPAPWEPDGVPLAQPRTLFEPELERFAESWAGAQALVPALRGAAFAEVVHGPEAFTPDGDFILGETEVDGLWVAAGFCVHGLAGAGGVGKVLAEWIVDGQPEWDVSAMDVARFGRHHRSRSFARERAIEGYARYYDVVLPDDERRAGRPLRVSPAYARLRALGADWGEKAGWERVNHVVSNAALTDDDVRPHGWAGVAYSRAIRAECHAVRDAAALFDQSSFSKFDVTGPGAAAALDRVCANAVAGEAGRATYTQLLNERGGIQADLTVTRLGEERFRVVTGTSSGVRDLAWIRRHVPADGTVTLRDVTGSLACFCLWGPRAREILQPLTDASLAHEDFRFLRARDIVVGAVPVLAQRITFVGELGWELYCSAEDGLALWDTLWAAGREHGMLASGYRAIDSLRLEKGYRVWGSDVTPNDTPDEAGLAFAVAFDKPGGFVGRDALARAREAGAPQRRLRCLVLDDPRTVCLGTEPVRVDGEPVGRVTSGGYGHRVERSIAYAYLPAAVEVGARVEIGVFADWAGAEVAAEPLWDPANERVRA